MKRLISLMLAVVMTACVLCSGALAADANTGKFTAGDIYKDGMFTDVAANSWYAGSVAAAVNYGFMKGQSATAFAPSGTVSWAEAVTIAARIHSIYTTGAEAFEAGTPWYKPYADYALKNGIMKAEPQNYAKAVTRAEFAVLLYNAVDDAALRVKNSVTDGFIPDVKGTESYGPAVYRFYRAGVLTGDTKHYFRPVSSIQRCEAAAVISRIANADLRLSVTLDSSILPPDGGQTSTDPAAPSGVTLQDTLYTLTQARQALALAQQYYSEAKTQAAASDATAAQSALDSAYKYAMAAATAAQNASLDIQSLYGKTTAYNNAYYGYLGALDASKYIKATTLAAGADWTAATSEMNSAAELLSKAYNELSK